MDEADKLCDRSPLWITASLWRSIALKLKASIPGNDILEISFSRVPGGWMETLQIFRTYRV